MTTVNFERVKTIGHKTAKCPGCGKTLRRQKTVERTINPFNRNKEGVPKSRAEIVDDNLRELKAWQEMPAFCKDCA